MRLNDKSDIFTGNICGVFRSEGPPEEVQSSHIAPIKADIGVIVSYQYIATCFKAFVLIK